MNTTRKTTPGSSAKRPAQSEALAGLELDARGAERRSAAAILSKSRLPLAVIEVAQEANAIAQSTLEKVHRAYPPPHLDCKDGCDWCCYQNVGTSAPETIRIVEYLRQTLTPDEIERLKDRVVRLDEQKRAMTAARRKQAKLACPLLVDHRCSAYPVRPLTCWGCNSTDVRACELSVTTPGRGPVPDYVPQRRLAAFVLDGLRAGLAEAKLHGDLLDLVAALRIALEVPSAAARWLAGEPIFAPARKD
jgi:hypothetical protein